MFRRTFAATLVTVLCLFSMAMAQSVGSMAVRLSSDQEVPPTANNFVGRFGIDFENDLSGARVNLTVFAANVVGAHLHCAAAGVNGPIVVNLLELPGLFGPPESVRGTVGKSFISNDDIIPKTADECAGQPINNIASLLAAIRQDLIYVNVHTTAFPPGAIRAQLWGHLLRD